VERSAGSGPGEWGLYLVTDRLAAGGRDLEEVIAQALQGGVRAIQLREKDLPAGELLRLGKRLLPRVRRAGVALLINDRVDVALALGADGVHLARGSLRPREVRGLAGSGILIGVSCHGLSEVREAVESGADFLVLGPVYPTPSKAPCGPPLTVEIIRQARAICPRPLLAIGGITAARVPEVVGAGADGVAVISAVFSATDPAAATGEILAAVARARCAPGGPGKVRRREVPKGSPGALAPRFRR